MIVHQWELWSNLFQEIKIPIGWKKILHFPRYKRRRMASKELLNTLSWPTLTVAGAVLVFTVQGIEVALARHKYNIVAPKVTGTIIQFFRLSTHTHVYGYKKRQ